MSHAYKDVIKIMQKKRKGRKVDVSDEIEFWRKEWKERGPVEFAENKLVCPPDVPPHPELGRVPEFVILTEDQKELLIDLWKGKIQYVILAAGRGCGKTFVFAIYVTWRLCCFDYFSMTVMGGSSEQSEKIKEYIDFWRRRDKDIFYCLYKSIGGGNKAARVTSRWEAFARFPACSIAGARGPHVTQLLIDEVCVGESRGKDGAQAILDATYQLTASPNQLLGYSCYDPQTEVLTKSGWKYINNIDKNDLIATLNKNTDELEYQYPIRLYKYPYHGKMYNAKNKNIDICVTPNHNLYLRNQNKEKFEEVKAEKTFGKYWYRYKTTCKWSGKEQKTFVLPSVNRGQFGLSEPINIPMNEWLKFFGFYIAEGWTTKNKSGKSYGYITGIRNNDSQILEELKSLLERNKFNPYYHGDTILEISNKQLYTYLSQFGKSYEKYISEDIKELSTNQLKIFLEYYLKGDGCLATTQMVGYTSSKKLKNDLQEIALKTGYASCIHNRYKAGELRNKIDGRQIITKHDSWSISFKQKRGIEPYADFRNGNSYEKWMDYNGEIYSCEVPNHIIYVRRNGKSYWSGNSTAQYILGKFYEVWTHYKELGFKRYRWALAKHKSNMWFTVNKEGKKITNWTYIDDVLYKDRNPKHWEPNVWWMTQRDVEAFRKNSTDDQWLVEILGGISRGSGLVFSRDDLAHCICDGHLYTKDKTTCDVCEPYTENCPMAKFYKLNLAKISERRGGVDFGEISPNAMTVSGKRGNTVFVLYNDERVDGTEEILKWVEETAKKYKLFYIFADPEERAMRETLELRGFNVPHIWAGGGGQMKGYYVTNTKRFVEQHRVVIPIKFNYLVNSISALAYDERGKVRKHNDHSWDSWMYSMIDYNIDDLLGDGFYGKIRRGERDIQKIW